MIKYYSGFTSKIACIVVCALWVKLYYYHTREYSRQITNVFITYQFHCFYFTSPFWPFKNFHFASQNASFCALTGFVTVCKGQISPNLFRFVIYSFALISNLDYNHALFSHETYTANKCPKF